MLKSLIQACPVGCLSELVHSDIILREGPLLKCTRCGQLLSCCTTEEYQKTMQEFEDPDGTWPKDASSMRRLNRLTGQLLKRAASITGKKYPQIRLLDVGCSSGAFIATAAQYGVLAEGVEPAAGPALTAQNRGLKVYQGFLEDLALPGQTYSIITLFEVIEHLLNPFILLNECHRLLQPGGVLIIRTGNTASWTVGLRKNRWEYFHLSKHGGHVSFFNPTSIQRLAERCELKVHTLFTRGVGIYDRQEVSHPVYRLCKVMSELMNFPSRLFGKGHEIIVFLQKYPLH